MKLYGYITESSEAEPQAPTELAEVTVCATPGELLKMADFLVLCAKEMERMGEVYDHIHLSDVVRGFSSSPHLVVAKPA